MAEEDNSRGQVGVVGSNQPGVGQPNSPGIPGVQAPPVPSPEEIAKVMERQKQETAKQISEARKRAGYAGVGEGISSATDAAPPNSRFSQTGDRPQQNPVESPVSGLSAEEVLAGPPTQQQANPQPSDARFARYSDPEPVKKDEVLWYPHRSGVGSVDVELDDTIIKNVPAGGVAQESDASAKVTLALFAEILAVRDRVNDSSEGQSSPAQEQLFGMVQDLSRRVYQLEATLFEQRQALGQKAKGVREIIEIAQSQGKTPDEVLQLLQSTEAQAEAFTQPSQPDQAE